MSDLSVKSAAAANTGTAAREHLSRLERETAMLVRMRDELNELLDLCRTDYGRELMNFKIREVSRRLVRAQAEIFAVEAAYFAELQSALRDEKYPPVPAARKSVIRYADE